MTTDESISKMIEKPGSDDGALENDLEFSTAQFLMGRYGPLLDAKALAEVLHYSSQLALERSMQRGHVKLRTFHLPGRRGVFSHAQEVASYITKHLVDLPPEEKLITNLGQSDLAQEGSRPKKSI